MRLHSLVAPGSADVAAVAIARRLGPGRTVATLQVDAVLKYLGGWVDASG